MNAVCVSMMLSKKIILNLFYSMKMDKIFRNMSIFKLLKSYCAIAKGCLTYLF